MNRLLRGLDESFVHGKMLQQLAGPIHKPGGGMFFLKDHIIVLTDTRPPGLGHFTKDCCSRTLPVGL
jgi:hypothetical protein